MAAFSHAGSLHTAAEETPGLALDSLPLHGRLPHNPIHEETSVAQAFQRKLIEQRLSPPSQAQRGWQARIFSAHTCTRTLFSMSTMLPSLPHSGGVQVLFRDSITCGGCTSQCLHSLSWKSWAWTTQQIALAGPSWVHLLRRVTPKTVNSESHGTGGRTNPNFSCSYLHTLQYESSTTVSISLSAPPKFQFFSFQATLSAEVSVKCFIIHNPDYFHNVSL